MIAHVLATLNPLTAEFRDSGLEAAFREANHRAELAAARLFALLVIFATLPFAFTIFYRFGPGPDFWLLLGCRLLVSATAGVLLAIAWPGTVHKKVDHVAFAVVLAIVFQTLLVTALAGPEINNIDLYFVIVIIFTYILAPTRLFHKVVSCVSVSTLFLMEVILFYNFKNNELVLLLSAIPAANILGIYANYHNHILRRHDFANGERLRNALSALKDSFHSLKTAHRRLERASKVKSIFLANVSHELRTPLNAINGFSEIIKQEMFGPIGNAQYREYVADIHKSGVSLMQTVDHILDLVDIESGAVQLTKSHHELKAAIDLSARSLSQAIADAGLRLSIDIPDSLPPLLTDADVLGRMIGLLLSSAIKRSDAGSEIGIAAGIGTDGDVLLTVTDCGRDIPPDEARTITELFGKRRPHRSGAMDVADLSLPLAESLALALGGRLRLHTGTGVGTSAEVRLPMVVADVGRTETSAA